MSEGLSVCLFVCLSVCLRKLITSEDRSVCLSVYLNVCLSVCLSERPSVCLFICIFVCMRNVGLGERTIITRLLFVSWLTGECAFCTGGIDNSWPFFSEKNRMKMKIKNRKIGPFSNAIKIQLTNVNVSKRQTRQQKQN